MTSQNNDPRWILATIVESGNHQFWGWHEFFFVTFFLLLFFLCAWNQNFCFSLSYGKILQCSPYNKHAVLNSHTARGKFRSTKEGSLVILVVDISVKQPKEGKLSYPVPDSKLGIVFFSLGSSLIVGRATGGTNVIFSNSLSTNSEYPNSLKYTCQHDPWLMKA